MMIMQWERTYAAMVADIVNRGDVRETRNAVTKSVFGRHLTINMYDNYFPLLVGRKMFYHGVFGELAAMLRQPKTIADFEKWGCNYWKLWGKEDGTIDVDYGNAWFDFNGFDQIADLKEKLKNNPTDRRMLINSWRPDRLGQLDLPCCHYAYQFYISDNKLSMMWIQRSVDMMIGLPSDIAFAAAWLIAICNEFGFEPGSIHMSLGDCHVYEEHWEKAKEYYNRVETNKHSLCQPKYDYIAEPGADFCSFAPCDLLIQDYKPLGKMEFKLHA